MSETAREPERRFLLDGPPGWLVGVDGRKVRRGYVVVTEAGTEVGLRKDGARFALTITEGQTRTTTEVEIGAAQFATLWPLTKGRRVKMRRYEFPREGFTFAVDVYRGKLKGLTTAEVEFPDPAVLDNFRPPAWLGRDVTHDERYRDRDLSLHGLPHVDA